MPSGWELFIAVINAIKGKVEYKKELLSACYDADVQKHLITKQSNGIKFNRILFTIMVCVTWVVYMLSVIFRG